MYQLITILAEYGFNPDKDDKSQEWNNCLVQPWRLLLRLIRQPQGYNGCVEDACPFTEEYLGIM